MLGDRRWRRATAGHDARSRPRFSIHTIGVILMILGAAGAVLALINTAIWSRRPARAVTSTRSTPGANPGSIA
jgi:hypothetical protein